MAQVQGLRGEHNKERLVLNIRFIGVGDEKIQTTDYADGCTLL